MTLLERHAQLDELAAAQRDAAAGRGSVAVVTGAAGIGKTALVQQFVSRSGTEVRWGLCDDLVTPRPLGPFRDMFGELSDRPDLTSFLEAALGELSRPPHPAVLVVEDAHWADQATLDALRFIGRRIRRLSALLIVTYRDDEAPADHELRLSLGAIPASDTRRIKLAALSPAAVAELAGPQPAADVAELYALTGGNPFFVKEALAAPDAGVPSTIQDAVMARVGKLDPATLASVEVASVVPGRAERWLLAACDADGVDTAIRRGVLFAHGETLAFTNELARRAVEDGLSPSRRRDVNRQVLRVLVDKDAEPARLTHHALQATDAAAVALFAPQAARRAAALGSHRVAAEHFEQALAHDEHIGASELAEIYEEYARECRLLGRHVAALEAVQRALEMSADTSEHQGRCLTLRSELCMLMDRRGDAERAVVRAVSVLEGLPPSAALAAAHAQRARLAMMGGRAQQAIASGEQSRRLAQQFGDTLVRAHADVTVGSARWQLDRNNSKILTEGLDAAHAAGHAYPAARAYVNLADGNMQLMRYESALDNIADGLTFCYDNDQLLDAGYLRACRAVCYLDQGRWTEAQQEAERAVDTARVAHTERTARYVHGLVQTRRGDPAAVENVGELGRMTGRASGAELRAMSARAELLFLTGSADWPDCWTDAARVRELLASHALPWSKDHGDAALWLARAGQLDDLPPHIEGPRALQIAGRWYEAADGWATLGRPYDQADALAEAPEPEALLAALGILDRLGATARASMVRARLAELGIHRVPRGPRRTTIESPAGLTPRQTEVLTLLADDLTYREIADTLHVSLKTVDHHMTAVRSKLAVSTRDAAVAVARRLGIVPPNENGGHGG